MTNELKSQRLSTPVSTNTATTITKEQSQPSQALDDELGETHSGDKRKQNSKDTFTQFNSDHDDLYSRLNGDMKQIRRYAAEIALHERSTVELRPDGSIVITPHPRPQLPTEIVSLILSHLAKQQKTIYECALVTKQFHDIANPLLWKMPISFRSNNGILERFLDCLSDASPQYQTVGRQIRNLSLDYTGWTNAQLTRLLPHLSHLKNLTIGSSGHLTDTNFQRLLYHCQLITSLQLTVIGLSQASFSAIGQHCHQLGDFKCTVLSGETIEWLEMLVRCPLKRLNIRAFSSPLNKKGMSIIKTFDHLTCLDIKDVSSGDMKFIFMPTTKDNNSSHLPMDNDQKTTSHWPQLTNLTLNPCKDLDDATLNAFLTSHPHIQKLDLHQASNLTDVSLNAISEYLSNHLTRVTLTDNPNITPNGVRRLVHQCRGLVLADFSGCDRLIADSLYSGSGYSPILYQETIDNIRQDAMERNIKQSKELPAFII